MRLLTLTRLRAEQADPTQWRIAPADREGLLDDQVQVAAAALDAHEVDRRRGAGSPWVTASCSTGSGRIITMRNMADCGIRSRRKERGFFRPAHVRSRIPPRRRPTAWRHSVPGGWRSCAGGRWIERRDGIVQAFAGAAADLGIYGSTLLLAMDRALQPATHLVIVQGSEAGAVALADAMQRAAQARFAPRRVVQRVTTTPWRPSRPRSPPWRAPRVERRAATSVSGPPASHRPTQRRPGRRHWTSSIPAARERGD